MRIWHEQLIPSLCRQHLLAVWREGLGCWKVLTENKKGYRNHPAVKEFEGKEYHLWCRLEKIRNEMIKRGYKPKDLPGLRVFIYHNQIPTPWQSLDEQVTVLKNKHCQCKIN